MYRTSGIVQNKIFQSVVFLLFMLLVNWQCSDFFEEDLSDDMVYTLAPADCLQTPLYTHNFWWDEVPGAQKYNLEIVSPAFDSIVRLVVDTNLTGNTFEYTLNPGTYQWRVLAFNSSSITEEYFINTLTIDTTLELTGEKIILKTPVNEWNTKDQRISFQWDKNPKADYYEVAVKKENWNGEPVFEMDSYIEDTITITLPEGKYIWGITGYNDLTKTLPSTRTFIVDTTRPAIPVLLSPPDKDTISESPVVLKWRRSASLSAIRDSIMIAGDSLFTDLIESFFSADTTYTLINDEKGTYFWKVKSIDAAGNKSKNYSTVRKFTIE